MTFRLVIVMTLAVSMVARAQTAPSTKPAKPVYKPPEVSDQQVDEAIKKAVAYIYSQQKGDNWDEPTPQSDPKKHPDQWGGWTAIATYALLAAGEKPAANPKLQAAVEWLKKNDKITGTYAVGLRAQVWNLLPPDASVKAAAKRDYEILLQGQRNRGAGKKPTPVGFRGMWHYVPTDYTTYDHSTAQYGTLGMWALEKTGVEISDDLWKATDEQWKKDQLPDGGWMYYMKPDEKHPAKSSLTMTAAGIATLFITQDYLRANDGIQCRGNVTNPPIQKGLDWMEDNLPKLIGGATPYGLYGIERIGVASGYKYFGTVDWYQGGAARLLKSQDKAGFWKEFNFDVPGTSFAVLFLVRGRAPVAINKLQYDIDGKEGPWNQRPRDAANAVKYMMKQMERDLNWQIVNLEIAAEELHDSPILYISGSATLKFTDAEEAKLREFAEQGGLILGHADCSNENFAKGFKALGAKLFNSKYEFRKLEAGHPIYTHQQFLAKNWKNQPDLQGLSNGVREMMLLIPTGDPGRAWQLGDFRTREDTFQLIDNILLYAVEGRDLRFKGSTYLVKADPKIKNKTTIKLARIELGDNWDPEPGGWRRMAAVMHNTAGVDLETVVVKPDAAALKPFKVAHLTGTTKINLNAAQQQALKDFVNGGGTLIIDAAAGDSDFAESIESQLPAIFGIDPEKLQNPLPADHPLYSASGQKLGEVAFRPFARGKLPSGQHTPLVRGIPVKDRIGVIYSREDLSGALVGESVDGLLGYTVASATELTKDMILYGSRGGAPPPASQPAKPPATQPAK
jgi:hypothetical protein